MIMVDILSFDPNRTFSRAYILYLFLMFVGLFHKKTPLKRMCRLHWFNTKKVFKSSLKVLYGILIIMFRGFAK